MCIRDRDSTGAVVGTGKANIYVWDGTYTDNFNRSCADCDVYGWFGPKESSVSWSILNNWMHVAPTTIEAPGSTGLLAAPLAQNAHVEATIQRTQATDYHYTDILVRMHPVLWEKSFYRIRILQNREAGGTLQMAVFRIDPGYNSQHGVLLDDRGQSIDQGPCATPNDSYCSADMFSAKCVNSVCRPVQPVDVPNVTQWNPALDQDIRVIADVRDVGGKPQFQVKFVNPSNPNEVFLSQTFTDDLPNPLMYPGVWGITSFHGDASFDDFILSENR